MPKVSPSFTEARREEILCACEELYCSADFKDISIKDIAEKTSLSRASIYNYFQTKEEIFLALLKREYDLWVSALEELRDNKDSLSVDEFADELAHTLEDRAQLLKIMSMNHYDMESNSSLEQLSAFKVAYGQAMRALESCLVKFFPDLLQTERVDFLYAFFPFMFGIYPYTFVKEKQRRAMEAANVNYVFMSIYELTSRFIKTLLRSHQLGTNR